MSRTEEDYGGIRVILAVARAAICLVLSSLRYPEVARQIDRPCTTRSRKNAGAISVSHGKNAMSSWAPSYFRDNPCPAYALRCNADDTSRVFVPVEHQFITAH
jgi:hypothetical protein